MSGKKEWLFRITDMLEHIEELQENLKDVSQQEFDQKKPLQRIAERLFEIIGESARHVPKDIQDQYDAIDWANIIGMRHKISHDYLDINPGVLWRTYKQHLDPLVQQLENLLEKEDI